MNNSARDPKTRRQPVLVIIGVIAGVLALVPAAFTSWFAGFTVVGLSGTDTSSPWRTSSWS